MISYKNVWKEGQWQGSRSDISAPAVTIPRQKPCGSSVSREKPEAGPKLTVPVMWAWLCLALLGFSHFLSLVLQTSQWFWYNTLLSHSNQLELIFVLCTQEIWFKQFIKEKTYF